MTDQRLAEIEGLLTLKAEGQYGLAAINQRQHALQAAWLAERMGLPAAQITAALLHDIGHMVHDLGEDPAKDGIDDHHEELGAAWLEARFGAPVTEPVRLHVAAKRYLCGKEADYFVRLSPDSVRSLALQGGPMSSDEIAVFEAQPHYAAAVQLRRFDEAAKVKGLEVPDARHYLPHIRACLRAA